MALWATKGDGSRGPGMPGPYRSASYAIRSGAPCRGHACVARGSARRRAGTAAGRVSKMNVPHTVLKTLGWMARLRFSGSARA